MATDPRWSAETLAEITHILGMDYAGTHDITAEEVLTWLADAGLLITPTITAVLERAIALRDWIRDDEPPEQRRPMHEWHIQLDQLEAALILAVDALPERTEEAG